MGNRWTRARSLATMQLVLDTSVSYGHRRVSRLRTESPSEMYKPGCGGSGPPGFDILAWIFKELVSGEQDSERVSVGQRQDFRAVI